ncbi:50S ribosomal protein L22 [Candidatus Woesearchaeota archaeon]|nr:50S ribosomal protein L22 [Candidatus Woesearchaeota archaeon]RLE41473.1 MAG: 50S ribosomal protein L22 [Candidatus Woesearchaeota archaeon]
MPYKYATQQIEHSKSAVAVGLNLPISTKHAVEVCRMLRGLPVEKAKTMLKEVIAKKRPVPFKRYNRDVGHKKGMAAGRYPVKASRYILTTIESAESNAADKGLLTEGLFIKSIIPHKAARPLRYGRHRSRRTKRTHIEVVLEERVTKEEIKPVEKKEKPKEPKQEEEKQEGKLEEPKGKVLESSKKEEPEKEKQSEQPKRVKKQNKNKKKK